MSWGMGPAVIRSTGADNSFPGALEHREGDLCARGPGLGSLVTRASLRPPAAGALLALHPP